MKKQQTAVEWLAEKYDYVNWMRNRDEISAGVTDELRNNFLEQAKKLEKQQQLESAVHILEYAIDCIQKKCETNIQMEFDEYYNETYGDELDTKSILYTSQRRTTP